MYPSLNNFNKSENAANCFKAEQRTDIVKDTVLSERKKVDLQNSNSFVVHNIAAAERVFLIDHIQDLIFLECDRQTLLTCRLVSHRCAHFSSKALQKIVKIKLALRMHRHQFAGGMQPFLIIWDEGRSVEDMTALMQRSTTEFPCNSFSFSDVDPANFLKFHGHLLKKLKIAGNVSLDGLKRLLRIEAPNLEHLSMRQLSLIDPDSFSKQGNSDFDETHTLQAPTPLLENLKVFKCNFQTPLNFVQQVLELSPNLAHVLLPNKYLHFLVRPVNRLHLLKVLKIDFRNLHFFELELVAKHHSDNMALEEISIFGVLNFREDLYTKAVDDVSTILKVSSATCKTLVLDGALKNFEIPQMPRVKHLSFGCREVDGQPIHMFLKGVSLGETFPSLKSLEIRSSYIRRNIRIGRFFGVEDPSPVPSVRNIYLRLFQPHDDLLRRFSEMFPNAASDPDCIDY